MQTMPLWGLRRISAPACGCRRCGWSRCLRGGELGHGLGALRHGMLGELTREDEADGRLDLPGGEGTLLGVAGQAGGLGGDLLEDVTGEGVHDGHDLEEMPV